MNKRLGLALLTLCAVSGAQAVNFKTMPVVGRIDKFLTAASSYAPALTAERFVRHSDADGIKETDRFKHDRVSKYGARNYVLGFWTLASYNAYKWVRGKFAEKAENEEN